MEPELYDDVGLKLELAEEQLESTELPDVALEDPAEESKAPAAARKLYDSFTRAAHPVMPSWTRSGQSGGGGSDGGGKETDGPGKNEGNVPAGLYSGGTCSALLGAVNATTVETSIEFRNVRLTTPSLGRHCLRFHPASQDICRRNPPRCAKPRLPSIAAKKWETQGRGIDGRTSGGV